MIGAVGNVLLLVVGYAASYLVPREHSSLADLTIWNWLRTRELARNQSAAGPQPCAELLASEHEI